MRPHDRAVAGCLLAALAPFVVAGALHLVRAADHADGTGVFAGWDMAGRRDANITNFFAFKVTSDTGDRLVLALLLNGGVKDAKYFFAEDLTVRFHIDTHSTVTRNTNPDSVVDDWMMRFGGTVTDVARISDDIVFEITFRQTDKGKTEPRLRVTGRQSKPSDYRMFPTGDEWPVRSGSALVVLEVSLSLINPDNPSRPLLLWATAKIPEINGPISDHMGMPGISNQKANLQVNRERPRDHLALIGSHPADIPAGTALAPYADVLIYDPSRDAVGFPPSGAPAFDPFNAATTFPNGRPLPENLRTNPFRFPYVVQ